MEDYVNFSFLTSSRHWDTWIKWINKLYLELKNEFNHETI